MQIIFSLFFLYSGYEIEEIVKKNECAKFV